MNLLSPVWCVFRPYGWCACQAQPRGETPRIVSKRRALCGRSVMFSGQYESRTPTCPACRRILKQNVKRDNLRLARKGPDSLCEV